MNLLLLLLLIFGLPVIGAFYVGKPSNKRTELNTTNTASNSSGVGVGVGGGSSSNSISSGSSSRNGSCSVNKNNLF
jgi:hypothetical protein